MRQISKGTLSLIRKEVADSFTLEELKECKDFEAFWELVDAQNAFEEEWESWKQQGIKSVYKIVFNERVNL